MAEFQDGGLTPASRTQGGDLIARLYKLQQATLGRSTSPPWCAGKAGPGWHRAERAGLDELIVWLLELRPEELEADTPAPVASGDASGLDGEGNPRNQFAWSGQLCRLEGIH